MGYDISIYHKIFDLVDENLKGQGEAFCYSYKAFSVLIGKAPNIVHVDEFAGLDADDYLTAVYLRCLNRLPDENSYKMIENLKEETEGAANYLILSAVVHSAEFAAINKTVTGMKQLKHEWKKERHFNITQILRLHMQAAKARCFGSLVIPIWVRIPNRMRNIVRKIAGRKSKPE